MFIYADMDTVVKVVGDDQPKDVKVKASQADLERSREGMKTEVSFHKAFGARGLVRLVVFSFLHLSPFEPSYGFV